jgi:hypothetical protein
MSDTQTPPPPALPPPDEPVPETEAAPARKRRDVVPWLYGFALLVLAGAVGWLLSSPAPSNAPDPRVAALEQQVSALHQQVTELQRRPVVDTAPLAARVAALEQKPAPAAVNLAPLETRLAKLEQKPDPTLPDTVGHSDLAALAGRMDAIAGRQDALTGRQDSVEADVPKRLDTLETSITRKFDATEARLTALDNATGKISALSDRAGRLARVQAARAALEAGQPLGELPSAPPALARFVASKPPTEAGLKLAFPEAARAALEASNPTPAPEESLLQRMWGRAQTMVTVRQGDRVIVGDAAAGVIARARHALDAGDLAGAVAALGALSGPAAQAMADWVGQAKALLDARAALASMAAAA